MEMASPKTVAFVFPGMGSQHPAMARGLYGQVPAFRQAVDRCCDLLSSERLLGLDLRQFLFANEADEFQLTCDCVMQPGLFVVEYALAQVFRTAGVRPVAVAGHSLGEFAAAVVGGLLTLDEALELVVVWAKAVDSLQGYPGGPSQGAMLSCNGLSAAQIKEIRKGSRDGLYVASYNSPWHCVVSGTLLAIADFERELVSEGTECRRLRVDMAYHSPLVSDACEKLEGLGVPSEKRVQECPVTSNFTGGWLNAMMLKTGHYWVDQMEKPVQWQEAASKLIGHVNPDVVVELGPGNSLSFLSSLCVPEGAEDPTFVQVMGHPKLGDSLDAEMLVQAFRLLSELGVDIDWEALDLPECWTTLSIAALAQHLESCSEAVLVKDADSLSDQMTNDGGSDHGDFMSPASSYASKDGSDVPGITLGLGSYCYDLVFG